MSEVCLKTVGRRIKSNKMEDQSFCGERIVKCISLLTEVVCLGKKRSDRARAGRLTRRMRFLNEVDLC